MLSPPNQIYQVARLAMRSRASVDIERVYVKRQWRGARPGHAAIAVTGQDTPRPRIRAPPSIYMIKIFDPVSRAAYIYSSIAVEKNSASRSRKRCKNRQPRRTNPASRSQRVQQRPPACRPAQQAAGRQVAGRWQVAGRPPSSAVMQQFEDTHNIPRRTTSALSCTATSFTSRHRTGAKMTIFAKDDPARTCNTVYHIHIWQRQQNIRLPTIYKVWRICDQRPLPREEISLKAPSPTTHDTPSGSAPPEESSGARAPRSHRYRR